MPPTPLLCRLAAEYGTSSRSIAFLGSHSAPRVVSRATTEGCSIAAQAESEQVRQHIASSDSFGFASLKKLFGVLDFNPSP